LAITFKHNCDEFWETFPDPGIGKAKQANEPMAGDIGRLFAIYKKVWVITNKGK